MEAGTKSYPLLGKVVVVIRAYNNRYVARAVETLLEMGLGRVIVVTHKREDKGATKGWLDTLIRRPEVRLTVLELDNYSWTAGLNLAIRVTLELNAARVEIGGLEPYEYLMPISVEAKPKLHHLAAMVDNLEANPQLGLVGITFRGLKDRNEVDLGVSYNHPRNTLAVWRLDVFRRLGEFGAFSDEFGGQEDIAKLVEMELDGHYTWTRLYSDGAHPVDLLVDIHYDQGGKEAREEASIMRHFAHYRARHATDAAAMARLDKIFDGIRRRIGLAA